MNSVQKHTALGLERGTVRMAPHADSWHAEAKTTMQALRSILGEDAVDIQHVGSTAIDGICAKPIIDIAVGIRDLNLLDRHLDQLELAGFVFRGEDRPGQLLLVRGNGAGTIRTHHIHVVEWNGEAWCRYIAFRDYLNGHPEAARAYDELKRGLAARYADDRASYTAAKQDFIERILDLARHARRRGW